MMSRIIALDFGLKRIGIAITDESNKLAFGLETVDNKDIISILKKITDYNVEKIVIGKPIKMNNTPSQIEPNILKFIQKIKKQFDMIKIERYDERFTSIVAKTIADSGLRKNKKKDKKLIDKISATLILQSYLKNKEI